LFSKKLTNLSFTSNKGDLPVVVVTDVAVVDVVDAKKDIDFFSL
jgi:hypothetical protein